MNSKHEFVAGLGRFALRRHFAERIARHRASYTSTLSQTLAVKRSDKLSRGSKRTLDPERNVGDNVRLNLELAIAEQLEENRLGQLDVRRGEVAQQAPVAVATKGREW